MRAYQVAALVLVAAAVAFIAGFKVGTRTRAPASGPAQAASSDSAQLQDDPCCTMAPTVGRNIGPAPKAPTGSGLPCLLELGSDECEACQLMEKVLKQVALELAGKADVVFVDTDLYPEEATRWRLRLIPTQIVLDAEGKELWRHEGYVSVEDLLAKLSEVGVRPGETTQTR